MGDYRAGRDRSPFCARSNVDPAAYATGRSLAAYGTPAGPFDHQYAPSTSRTASGSALYYSDSQGSLPPHAQAGSNYHLDRHGEWYTSMSTHPPGEQIHSNDGRSDCVGSRFDESQRQLRPMLATHSYHTHTPQRSPRAPPERAEPNSWQSSYGSEALEHLQKSNSKVTAERGTSPHVHEPPRRSFGARHAAEPLSPQHPYYSSHQGSLSPEQCRAGAQLAESSWGPSSHAASAAPARPPQQSHFPGLPPLNGPCDALYMAASGGGSASGNFCGSRTRSGTAGSNGSRAFSHSQGGGIGVTAALANENRDPLRPRSSASFGSVSSPSPPEADRSSNSSVADAVVATLTSPAGVVQYANSDDAEGNLAKADGPTQHQATRKQNSACDACRRRKVRCIRNGDEKKCALCKAKGVECTSIYVSQATNATRKPSKRAKFRSERASSSTEDEVPQRVHALLRFLFVRSAPSSVTTYEASATSPNDGASAPKASRSESQRSLLSFLPAPSSALEAKLSTTAARLALAHELINTYFSIMHPRFPVLNPQTFREQHLFASSDFRSTYGQDGAISEPVLAMVLLWGAKFSDHPIIVEDRKECAEALQTIQKNWPASRKRKAIGETAGVGSDPEEHLSKLLRQQGVSRISEHIFQRVLELFDSKRVSHNPSVENSIACLLMIPYAPAWPRFSSLSCYPYGESIISITCKSWDNFYLRTGLEHMRQLGYDRQDSLVRISDPERRRAITLCWWLMVLADSFTSVLYRRQPELSYDDYTTEPPRPMLSTGVDAPNLNGNEAGHSLWIQAQGDLIEVYRLLSKTIWAHRRVQRGVSLHDLQSLVKRCNAWKAEYLHRIGIPRNWPKDWDFIAAISACTSENQYTVLWFAMFMSLEEHGMDCEPHQRQQADDLQRHIYNETLHWALRMADLAQMLSCHGYLRLDPNIMRVGLLYAGYCLARFQRSHEVDIIVSALHQYGWSTEECYDQADRLQEFALQCSKVALS
ncbi:hypothetical protein K437DRAFT_55129 [Tilletiaria anomala UBC 951]|uniref:Zn(2)-C6 fungal-type domain-containing protein n=1 Tax=Tilletiaria anomala (strain ATCC 24038 / CBS 436.72 / UBC 951) TaxID=1037660 RepID=A0A066WBH5_TILAU|nr:uncharacterized protein K437DRAFT_55129 [Tilletiaria anomala UBC 951]KDN51297.1 hypothetical protein K437DRAFT_55129 [Tilletiaria anomala UBC 951]